MSDLKVNVECKSCLVERKIDVEYFKHLAESDENFYCDDCLKVMEDIED